MMTSAAAKRGWRTRRKNLKDPLRKEIKRGLAEIAGSALTPADQQPVAPTPTASSLVRQYQIGYHNGLLRVMRSIISLLETERA